MMNICIVQPNRYTYSETFIRRHIAMLSASHNVSLFYPYGDGFGNRDGPFLKKAGLVRRAGRSMMRRLFRVDAEYFTRKATVSRLIQGNTNVVLAEYGQMGVHMLPACKEADIPLVVHFHGYDAYYGPVLQEYRSRYLEMFRYAAKIISVSLDMTNQLAALGCPKEKICLKPYGVPVNEVSFEMERYSTKKLLAVGRFVEKKAPYLTLFAFKKLLDEVPDAHLVMVGSGELLQVCIQMAKSLCIENVVFPGALENDEVLAIMQRSAIFVQHSIRPPCGDSEGMPVAILEAAATGLPVVSTRHAGIMESVIHEKSGLLVAEGDVDGMAKAMITLINNPARCKEMGQCGHEHIKNHYTYANEGDVLQHILFEA